MLDAADTKKKLGKNVVEYCYNTIMFLEKATTKKNSLPNHFEMQEAQFIGNYLYSRKWRISYSRFSQSPLKLSSQAGRNNTEMSLSSIFS